MSDLETALAFQIRAAGLPTPEREHKFHPVRKWRFDFAWPLQMLAVEVEGGTWSRGRHTRPQGFEEDCIKYNECILLGWRVIRVTGDMIEDGRALQYVEALLKETSSRS